MAVKPWVGTVAKSVPSNFNKKDKKLATIPDQTLDLEYVYGYRCEDTRNNLRYNLNNQLVYHTAAVGIVMNQTNNSQKHFLEHNDDIISLDVYDNMVVTGQIGHLPTMSVWNSDT